MTENEWLTSDDLTSMLMFLHGKLSVRKSRLFGLACCRRMPGLFPDRATQAVLLTAERFADGIATDEGLIAVMRRAGGDEVQPGLPGHLQIPPWWQMVASALGPMTNAGWLVQHVIRHVHDAANDRQAVRRAAGGEEIRAAREAWAKAQAAASRMQADLCRLLRDVFSYQVKTCEPGWLTSDVLGLACTAYEERALPSGELDFVRLAVLADALEEAGCEDTAILGHLRAPGVHIRGCWGVDLIIGRT
jgi:hypothetical protein